jgi:hypothetical protein
MVQLYIATVRFRPSLLPLLYPCIPCHPWFIVQLASLTAWSWRIRGLRGLRGSIRLFRGDDPLNLPP